MWVQYKKFIKVWLHHIRNIRIQATGRTHVFNLHHPPTLEASTRPTKKISYKYCTQFYLLLLVLRNIDMWHAGIVNHNQLKLFLVRLTQHHQVLRASTACDLNYFPFHYYTNYCRLKYARGDRHKCPHSPLY